METEDIHELVKDISRFQNRNLRRSLLMDPRMNNFILTPDNGYPVMPYNANFSETTQGKDEYLLMIKDELEYMKDL